MAKPILLSVDDDSDVLRAIERDLRSKYGAEYRVIGSDSPEGALTLLKQLKVRNDSVALLLADQRMPHMDGVAFLQEGMRIFPEAKRALLTAYADTNAAISAINQANINYFFMKPWDPPAEHLYPQLDDLLDDWQASYRPTFEGIRVLGTRWSPRSYELRDFLARNRVPYQWIDVELPPTIRKPSDFWRRWGRSREPSGRAFPGRHKTSGKRSGGSRAKGWVADPRANQLLRPGDRRRRPGGPGGCRLWRVGGSAHGDDRARSAGRAGGNEFAHRELSWISHGAQRRRSGPARGGAGPAFWSGNSVAAGGRRRPNRRALPDHQIGGRKRDLLPRA